MLAELALIAAATVLVVACTGGVIRPFHFTFAYEACFAIGAVRLLGQHRFEAVATDPLVVGICLLVVGYAVVHWSIARMSPAAPPERRWLTPVPRHAIALTLWFFAGLTALHFSVVGLVVFAPDVEIRRWDFTASGLFGLPGRAYLFGLPVMVVMTAAVRWTPGGTRRLFVTAVALLVTTRLVGGFKGELLQACIWIAVLALLLQGPRSITSFAARFAPIALAALGVGVLVSLSYLTVEQRLAQGRTPVELLWDRATVGAAEAALDAIDLRSRGLEIAPGDTIVGDLRYYAGRYVPGVTEEGYDFISRLSAWKTDRNLRTGRSLTYGEYVVPQTPGAFAVLFYNYGGWAYLLMPILGALFAVVENAAGRARTFTGFVVLAVGLFVLHDFIHKGELAHPLFNWAIILALGLIVVTTIQSLVLGARHGRSDPVAELDDETVAREALR